MKYTHISIAISIYLYLDLHLDLDLDIDRYVYIKRTIVLLTWQLDRWLCMALPSISLPGRFQPKFLSGQR